MGMKRQALGQVSFQRLLFKSTVTNCDPDRASESCSAYHAQLFRIACIISRCYHWRSISTNGMKYAHQQQSYYNTHTAIRRTPHEPTLNRTLPPPTASSTSAQDPSPPLRQFTTHLTTKTITEQHKQNKEKETHTIQPNTTSPVLCSRHPILLLQHFNSHSTTHLLLLQLLLSCLSSCVTRSVHNQLSIPFRRVFRIAC